MDQDNPQNQQARDTSKQQGQPNYYTADYATAEAADAARTADSLKMNDTARDTAETRDVTDSARDTSETRTEDAARTDDAARDSSAPVDPATGGGDPAINDSSTQVADQGQTQMVIGSDNLSPNTEVPNTVADTTVAADDSAQIDTSTVDAAIDVAMGDSDSLAGDDALTDVGDN